jgi:hypothetical protein
VFDEEVHCWFVVHDAVFVACAGELTAEPSVSQLPRCPLAQRAELLEGALVVREALAVVLAPEVLHTEIHEAIVEISAAWPCCKAPWQRLLDASSTRPLKPFSMQNSWTSAGSMVPHVFASAGGAGVCSGTVRTFLQQISAAWPCCKAPWATSLGSTES